MSPPDPSSRPTPPARPPRVSRGLGWLRRRGGAAEAPTAERGADPPGVQGRRDAAYRIELVTRPGCHLCDEVRPVVEAVAAETGVSWHEVSLLDDPVLMERWRDDIPVVLVDGALVARWRCDAATLRAALRGD